VNCIGTSQVVNDFLSFVQFKQSESLYTVDTESDIIMSGDSCKIPCISNTQEGIIF
jgi:hypothetical protein